MPEETLVDLLLEVPVEAPVEQWFQILFGHADDFLGYLEDGGHRPIPIEF